MAASAVTKNKWSQAEYSGPTKNHWEEGQGTFQFPHGPKYEGEFRKGEFHGEGALIYPNGGRYVATWNRGVAVKGHYVFNDGLEYQDRNWQYVSSSDRRFYTEVKQGLKPAGQTLMTNDGDGAPEIPECCYDTGNGYFHPDTEKITSYDGEHTVGLLNDVEIQWIKRYCRYQFPANDQLRDARTKLDDVPENVGV